MGTLHITEAELARDIHTVLTKVQEGAEFVVERDHHPVAVIRSPVPKRRLLSECIALAEAHEKESGQAPVLDPDFAADVEEIVRNRKPWNPTTWG